MVLDSTSVRVVTVGVSVPRKQQVIARRGRVGELKVVRANGHSFSGETRLQAFSVILCTQSYVFAINQRSSKRLNHCMILKIAIEFINCFTSRRPDKVSRSK